MDNARLPQPDDEPAPIADVEALFRDDPPSNPPPTPATEGPVTGDSYEVGEAVVPSAERAPVVDPALRASPPPTPRSRESGPARAEVAPEESVREVWTRTAEWGRTALVLVAVGLAVLLVVYVLLSFEEFSLAFLALLLGGLTWVVLTYPILITLERPVRVTPEQAARDFFGALSHHVPHYRRMWLLLSDAGKYGGSFATFEGFRNYWKGRMTQFRGGRISAFTPLKFVVSDFRSKKSAGLTDISASYTVNVFVRGRLDAGPLETFRVESTLVKGPDRMWYLDRGTLP